MKMSKHCKIVRYEIHIQALVEAHSYMKRKLRSQSHLKHQKSKFIGENTYSGSKMCILRITKYQ